MIEVVNLKDLQFEEAYKRLSKRSKIRITSDQDDDGIMQHKLSFVDPEGNLCTIIGDELQEVMTTALSRVEVMRQTLVA